jgi:hypothetical protein
MDSFTGLGTANDVEVDVVTDAYRISGTVQTRFARLTDILNEQAGTHLTITHATISEHADPTATVAASSALAAVSAILIMSDRCPTPIRSSYFQNRRSLHKA